NPPSHLPAPRRLRAQISFQPVTTIRWRGHTRFLKATISYCFDVSSRLFSCGLTVDLTTMILLSISNQNGAPSDTPSAVTPQPRSFTSQGVRGPWGGNGGTTSA